MDNSAEIKYVLEVQCQLVSEMFQLGKEIGTACTAGTTPVENVLSLFSTRTNVFTQLEEKSLPESVTLNNIAEGNQYPEFRDLAIEVQSMVTALLHQNAAIEEQLASIRDNLGESILQVRHAMNFETKYHPKKPPYRRGAVLDEKG